VLRGSEVPHSHPSGPFAVGFRAPRSAHGRAAVNMGFVDKLGKMTRDFEEMAAGKLMLSGSKLHLGDMQDAGKTQLRMTREAMKTREPHRKGKKTRRAKGTTKKDDVDDEDTAFALRSIGMEQSGDADLREARATLAKEKELGSFQSSSGLGEHELESRAHSLGVDVATLRGASSNEAALIAEQLRRENHLHSDDDDNDDDDDEDDDDEEEVAAEFVDATATGGSAFSLGFA
jgi:hypothetical protein